MKTRNGFVSNSSSSSFIVAFTKVPTSIQEVKDLLFPGNTWFYGPYDDRAFETAKIAETIFNDMQEQKPNDKELIKHAFQGWLEGMPDSDSFQLPPDEKHKFGNVDWDKWEKALDAFRNIKMKEFKKSNPKTTLYVFSYSDNDGDYFTALEHGNIFRNVSNIRISHH